MVHRVQVDAVHTAGQQVVDLFGGVEDAGSVTWKLEVEDTQYGLWVSGADMSKPPSDIWLIDWNTGDRMILGEDDLEQFLAEHNQK